MEGKYPDELQTYVDKFYRRTYHDFTIDKRYLCGECILQEKMKWEWHVLLYSKDNMYILEKHSFSCVKNTTETYRLNLLSIIKLVYHMYIEYELYKLAYKKIMVFPMKINSYMEPWVSWMIIIHSWKSLEYKEIDFVKL